MIRRVYLQGLTWERAQDFFERGWSLAGVTLLGDGSMAVAVYRDADSDEGEGVRVITVTNTTDGEGA